MNDRRRTQDRSSQDSHPGEAEGYLWDSAAPPDAEIEQLERTLSAFRYQRTQVEMAQAPRGGLPSLEHAPPRKRPLLAMAAAIGILFLLAWISQISGTSRGEGWTIDSVSGVVRVGADVIEDAGRLRIGQWLQTDTRSRSRLTVADIGTLTVHPNSRLRLLRSDVQEHRLALDQGRIDALIYAPPRLFFVDTPGAVAVDLGCAYSLVVDEDGHGRIEVSFGWVALESSDRVSTVPADGVCWMDAAQGPGTPFFEDAPPALVSALRRFDFEGGSRESLEVILRSARPRDTLTLWHLLSRVALNHRGAVAQRLADLSALPSEVSVEALCRLDATALDRSWSFLENTW